MTPEEMKQRLAAVDEELAEKLLEMGFTPDEVRRAMDHSISAEIREREAKEILAREVAKQMADPKSPLFRAALDRAAREVEAEMNGKHAKEIEAERARAKQTKTIAIAGAMVLLIGVVYFVVIKKKQTSICTELLGPIDRIEKIAKMEMRVDEPIGAEERCDMYVWSKDKRAPEMGPWVIVHNERAVAFDQMKRELEGKAFVSHEKIAIAQEAYMFVAGARQPDDAHLLDDAKARVGRSRDPMGDALAALPPDQHTFLVLHGQYATTLELSDRKFTAEQAKALAAEIAKDWK